MSAPVLVHMATTPSWRAALHDGRLRPASLAEQGFVHLSTPEQVHLPANRLHAGHTDLVLVCLDPRRLADPLRWEPGVPGDPASMRFPHLYGPLPTTAAVAVVPYRPDGDGSFAAPTGVPHPDDATGRALAWYHGFPVRRARRVVPVDGGVAVLDDRHPLSHEHNCVLLRGEVDADAVVAQANRVLAGLHHRSVTLDHPGPASELADRGWEVQQLVIMAAPVSAEPAPWEDAAARTATTVDQTRVHPLWRAGWRTAGLPATEVEALVAREATNDDVAVVLDVAVGGTGGEVISSAQLRVDGASAALEAVMTAPDERGRGHGRDVLRAAFAQARARDVDTVVLEAAADDWPRRWYARLGFVEVGRAWECTVRG